ncbi:MAG TPA: GNAT family N-acetyltransferase [Clostridiales bacterium]|nr:GNAT family N-acetyltransferase [Clostridiales bacterium]
MIMNKWVTGNGDLTDAFALRKKVFVEEQHVAEVGEFDGLDEQSIHLVVYDGELPVATGRIWHDGKTFRIGRCCVERAQRGMGIGDLLIKLLLLKVFEYNPSEVRIHAQTHAEKFYEKYGFERIGDEYDEEGLPHVTMRATKETLRFPSKCGEVRRFEDFFKPVKAGE